MYYTARPMSIESSTATFDYFNYSWGYGIPIGTEYHDLNSDTSNTLSLTDFSLTSHL